MNFLRKRGSLLIAVVLTAIFIVLYGLKESARKDLEWNPEASFKFLELVEAKAYDIRFQLAQLLFPQEPSNEVVIIAMDDRSTREFGWPFPRALWGDMLKKLEGWGVEVVGFDMVFLPEREYQGLEFIHSIMYEYEQLGFSEAVSEYEGPKDEELADLFQNLAVFEKIIRDKESVADQNKLFGADLAAIDKNKMRVVMGWYYYRSEAEAKEMGDDDFLTEASLLESAALPYMPGGWGMDLFYKRMWPVRAYGLQPNVEVISEGTEDFGYFTSTTDPVDGSLRRFPMITVFSLEHENPTTENTYVYPGLSLAVYAAHQGNDPVIETSPLGVRIMMGDTLIPTDRYGRALINWAGPQGTYTYHSVYDVLTDFKHNESVKDPAKIFQGKIALVGSTAIGAHDMRTIPFGTAPGVEMHANLIGNMLGNNLLVRPEWFAMFDYLFLLAVGILLALILPRLRSITGGILALALFLGYLTVNMYFFVEQNYSFTVVYPLAEILTIYIGITLFRYATEEREKRFIKGAFSQYLSPKVIDQLVADPSKLKLGGEDKEITAFFSDIQSFSSFSEKMTTQGLVHFLNIYLTEMCDIILAHEGTIDKFEGDAIIAFFGAPMDNPEHAKLAVLCTADIQHKMVGFREKWLKEGFPEVHMRIGLNSGIMSVGNMGSRDRMDYTIMGDNVNLAARLESAAKQYKIYSMISEETKNQAGEVAEYRELDAIRVKGRENPVKVFEILGKKGEVAAQKMEAARVFEEGLKLYRQRYWMPAREKFEKALEINPDDGPSRVFIARCEEFSDNPPGSGWDGVYTLTSK